MNQSLNPIFEQVWTHFEKFQTSLNKFRPIWSKSNYHKGQLGQVFNDLDKFRPTLQCVRHDLVGGVIYRQV